MKSKKNSKHYVDNQKFYECIVDYKRKVYEAIRDGREKPLIPEFAGRCILLIAENTAKMRSFNGYSYKEEMISDGILNCTKYFDNFDENKYTNPHAYFTMVCVQANIQRIKDEKKNRYAIYKKFEEDFILNSNRDLMLDEKNNLIVDPVYDNISEYIQDFEIKDKENKSKRLEKLKEKRKQQNIENERFSDVDETE